MRFGSAWWWWVFLTPIVAGIPLTRAKEILGCLLAVLDDIKVIRETLLKLGIGKAYYTRRREFEKKLSSIASQTQPLEYTTAAVLPSMLSMTSLAR
jgi:hypothetical protein